MGDRQDGSARLVVIAPVLVTSPNYPSVLLGSVRRFRVYIRKLAMHILGHRMYIPILRTDPVGRAGGCGVVGRVAHSLSGFGRVPCAHFAISIGHLWGLVLLAIRVAG